MKITKTIVTTIELDEGDKKLLAIEYKEFKRIMDKNISTKQDRLDTIHELIENLLN